MIKPRLKPRNQSGDTIVEVMIVIIIISSVLVGAFLVAQRSASAVRDSQERSEMLQILQGQVELVRSAALKESDDITGVFAPSLTYFCMDAKAGSSTYGQVVKQPNITTNLSILNTYTIPQCGPMQNRYYVAVKYNRGSTDKTFTFYGRWDSLTGRTGTEQLTYRVYPGAATP